MAKRVLSAKQVLAILIRDYGFVVVSQRGSHIKLRRGSIKTIVPNHSEIAFGTLQSILKQAEIDPKDFWSKK